MLTDLRFTLRSLAKAPGFVLVALFTLALGIGVNATMFSIVNAVLLRGLPYERPEELVAVNLSNPTEGWLRGDLSMEEFNELAAGATTLEGLFSMQSGTFNVSGGELAPERFTGTWMTGSGLQTIGAQPRIGRWWTAEEELASASPVVVISETLWQTRFGAAPDVVGQTLRVNGEVATVIGVTQSKFDFPDSTDLWMPRRYSRTDEERDTRYLNVVGRLRPGVTIEQARGEMEVLFAGWAANHAEMYDALAIRVVPLKEDFIGDNTARMLGVMMTCVTMVLLIACTNVANLLLVRGSARAKELAVRTALGAARGRTVRLLLMESLVLALGGAALGLPLAQVLLDAFDRAMALSGETQPAWMTWEIDGMVLLYVAGVAVVTCVLAGLLPALRLSTTNLVTFLNDASRGSTGAKGGRLTRVLVVGEVALSCVLLVMSGLMIHSVIKSADIPLGYDPDGIMSARIGLPEAQYTDEPGRIAFFEKLLRNVQERPEVTAAALSTRLPTWDGSGSVVLEDSPLAGGEVQPRAGSGYVSRDWFATLGVQLVDGRDFMDTDTAERDPVALVNLKAAETFWPGESAIGKRLKLGHTDDLTDAPWVTVVGVTPSVYQGDFEDPLEPQVYLAMTQGDARYYSLLLRTTTGDASTAAAIMREEVRRIDPDLPIYWVQPLQQHIDQAQFFGQLFAWIFGIFGGVALVLAAVGIYGVMAYSVSQRVPEIGVRVALGANPRSIMGLVLRQGGRQLGIGLVVGLGLSFFAAQMLQGFLYQVEPTDPPAFGATVIVLLTAGAFACAVPAWRALRVSPMEALRGD
ncbi:ABC transporter permease [Actomonas aquatica]|uniref:ABC transporter permease n=1 Tax=Actomonas aquatica TaxID=2866162 RepID=A0ABZ1CAX8_9BACT|nr:ABC transporter permease [Opitutus sp. WL0086]WRQ88744.1 ABC transporter permease [Opitutus sp. WL0086]